MDKVAKKVAFRFAKRSAWENLPEGWTQESLNKMWESLTGDRKHKVTACIKAMEGNVDDPGAFCASLADKMEPGWRSKKASFDLSVVDRIQRLTSRNDHSGALLLGAKSLGATQLLKRLELVAQLQKLEGHLPSSLRDYQYSLYDALMAHAKRTLDPEEYKLFYGAY